MLTIDELRYIDVSLSYELDNPIHEKREVVQWCLRLMAEVKRHRPDYESREEQFRTGVFFS